MANYNGNRHDEEFIFQIRDKQSWGTITGENVITGGSLEFSTDSDVCVTGRFTFKGYNLPSQGDYINVLYRWRDDEGTLTEQELAFLQVSYADISYTQTINGLQVSGTLTGQSSLSWAKTKQFGTPKTFKKGTNVISTVQELLFEVLDNTEIGEYVILATADSFKLTNDYTVSAGTKYLTAINDLLSLASYKNVFLDYRGYVILEKLDYTKNINDIHRNEHSFINNNNSIMYPEIQVTNNLSEIPNVVKIFYNTDTDSVLATASNLYGSSSSLSEKPEVTYFESTSNMTSLQALKERAENLLKSKSSDIEYVKFNHAYAKDMTLYDKVYIDYGDKSWEGYLTNYTIELSPGVKTTSKVKKELVNDITVESSVRGFIE